MTDSREPLTSHTQAATGSHWHTDRAHSGAAQRDTDEPPEREVDVDGDGDDGPTTAHKEREAGSAGDRGGTDEEEEEEEFGTAAGKQSSGGDVSLSLIFSRSRSLC